MRRWTRLNIEIQHRTFGKAGSRRQVSSVTSIDCSLLSGKIKRAWRRLLLADIDGSKTKAQSLQKGSFTHPSLIAMRGRRSQIKTGKVYLGFGAQALHYVVAGIRRDINT